MDSFEWNKIIGAVLGTVLFIFVVRTVAELPDALATVLRAGDLVLTLGAGDVGTAPGLLVQRFRSRP